MSYKETCVKDLVPRSLDKHFFRPALQNLNTVTPAYFNHFGPTQERDIKAIGGTNQIDSI